MTNLKVREITCLFEKTAPLCLQESYDNSGLLIGSPEQMVSAALITIDVTEKVVDEAIHTGSDIIISHHPLIFNGLKSITGKNDTERAVIKSVQNKIAVYCAHTNFDAVHDGVNKMICNKLDLTDTRILRPAGGILKKLVTFIPEEHAAKVRTAVFNAGAGHIGNYDMCSFNTQGLGSFRGNETTHPFAGKKMHLSFEKEVRFETIFPSYRQKEIIDALLQSHPYEEVAFDIYPLENRFGFTGMGMTGVPARPVEEEAFLSRIKDVFNCRMIRLTRLLGKPVARVAVCGGSGSFLLNDAIAAGADLFISADFKYHQFFEAEGKTVIIDIGHFESEQFTKELFQELLTKKFPTFAVRLSEVMTNPVKYL